MGGSHDPGAPDGRTKIAGSAPSAFNTITAAVAEAHGCTVVTDNEKEFAGVVVINLLRASGQV